jgi:hypothetical protein
MPAIMPLMAIKCGGYPDIARSSNAMKIVNKTMIVTKIPLSLI